jgi:hypothetical protein
MPVISIHERDHERHNVIITTPMQQSPAWDCDQFNERHTYHTFSHEYFVVYTTINTETGTTYEGLACLWNCKVDHLPSAGALSRWMIGHNAMLAANNAASVKVLTCTVYRSATREKVITL